MEDLKLIGQRFGEERARLGFSLPELADLCGTSRQSISRFEKGVNPPPGDVLASFARAGADMRYILVGEREGRIDSQLYGICEAALRLEYEERSGKAPPAPVRPRATALVYNQIKNRLQPAIDEVPAVRKAARDLIESYDDPSVAWMLERNLFALPPTREQDAESGTTVTGDNNRVAGRDYHER